MNIPRQYGSRLLAALAVAALAAALPLARTSAQQTSTQQAPAKQQSPNGKIVFQSTQGGDGFVNDIYVMDADGKHQTRLTDDVSDDVSAVWSPQGDRIAFLSARRGNGYELYLMNADGSNQHPLRDASPVVPFDGFEWSPDGTRLAYGDGANVWVVAADGNDPAVNVSVNKAAGSSDREPSWSPNGGQLVVRNSVICSGCSDLYVVNSFDGAGRYRLSTGPGFDASPRWSPAGNLVAYEGDRNGRGIYVTPADGTGSEAKISGAVESFGGAVWSPDGTRLAFKAISVNVYSVRPDGSGLTPVSDVPADGDSAIFWSPDGTKVGFHGSVANFVDIFVVEADGTARRAVNYTKSRRDDEVGHSWQRLPTP